MLWAGAARTIGEIALHPRNPDLVYITFLDVPDDGVATIPFDFQGCS